MLIALIVACEIGFWVLLLAGLVVRYVLRLSRLSLALLVAAPLVDLVLLMASAIDLQDGGEASRAHALAAVYVGCSVAFGHRMVRWADTRFAVRFAGAPRPPAPSRWGRARAARERRDWLQHLLAWAVGCTLLGGGLLLVGDLERGRALLDVAGLWTLVVVIDGAVSLSYTVFPRHGAEDDAPLPVDGRAASRT